jgi:hypothetical protein
MKSQHAPKGTILDMEFPTDEEEENKHPSYNTEDEDFSENMSELSHGSDFGDETANDLHMSAAKTDNNL